MSQCKKSYGTILGDQIVQSIFFIFNRICKGTYENCKVSGCEAINEWIRPCTNHLYWSAKTTHDGNAEAIWAKFSSFLSHVVNKHENLDNPSV